MIIVSQNKSNLTNLKALDKIKVEVIDEDYEYKIDSKGYRVAVPTGYIYLIYIDNVKFAEYSSKRQKDNVMNALLTAIANDDVLFHFPNENEIKKVAI